MQYGSSTLAIIAGVVLLILGVLVGFVSLLGVAFGAASGPMIEEFDPTLSGMGDAIAAVIIVLSAVFLILSILHVVAAVGVFVHKSWSRWLGIVLAAIGLVLGVLALFGAVGDPTMAAGDFVLLAVWLTAYGFILAALAAGGRHFTPFYPSSMRGGGYR